jgi:hypothetical protein|tara:strand:+ start:329 stop:877 length:549 start_codon:yes stop_codon:yes gene_type:complete
MRLSYSIPNKLWWIHDFLDQENYKGIHNAIFKERGKINLHSVEKEWNKTLYDNIKTMPERVGVSDYPPFETLKNLIRKNDIFTLPAGMDMNTNIHYLKKDSGINWHNDGGATYGATWYLNRRWHPQWGGEFMFKDSAGHGFIPPTGNSLILVKSPFEHKVNTVLSPLIPRITVQLFMKASTS